MRRRARGSPAGSSTLSWVPPMPIRSIFPRRHRSSTPPASYTANRMLDEPPLIARTQGVSELMASFRDESICPRIRSGIGDHPFNIRVAEVQQVAPLRAQDGVDGAAESGGHEEDAEEQAACHGLPFHPCRERQGQQREEQNPDPGAEEDSTGDAQVLGEPAAAFERGL